MRKPLRKLGVLARRSAREQGGFALATVMLMLLGVFTVVSVGIVATMQAQSGTVRDQSTKSALTAADTGLSQALFRYNAYTHTPGSSQPCVAPSGTALGVSSTQTSGPQAGWCEPVNGADGSGGFSYQVCPGAASSPCNTTPSSMLIVATGTYNGVTRRVETTVRSSTGQGMFLNAQVQTQNGLNLDSGAQIYANSATNGDITLGSGAKQCGVSTVGPGHHVTIGPAAGYYQGSSGKTCTTPLDPTTVGQQTISLPPVNQGDAPTNNDDYRITNALSTANPPPTPADITTKRNGVSWSPSTRRLSLGSATSLTLTGRTYSFCQLTLGSSTNLYIAAGTNVNIYFDSPESCGLSADDALHQMSVASSSRITSNSVTPANVALYFVGSQSRATGITMNSSSDENRGCIDNFVIYAPFTDVSFNSSSYYCGALAAKSLTLGNNSEIHTDSLSKSFSLPGVKPHYATSQYVECTAQPASVPNSGC